LRKAARQLNEDGQALVLAALSSAWPDQRERLVIAAKAAATDAQPANRAAALVAVATATDNADDRSDLLIAAQAAASSVDSFSRAAVLATIATASGDEDTRHQVLEAANEVLALTEDQLVAMAQARPSATVRARLETVIEEFDSSWRARPLFALAATSDTADERARRLAAAEIVADQTYPRWRSELLVELANASDTPDGRERLLAKAEVAAADDDAPARARMLNAIADADADVADAMGSLSAFRERVCGDCNGDAGGVRIRLGEASFQRVDSPTSRRTSSARSMVLGGAHSLRRRFCFCSDHLARLAAAIA
jgi:hypothetical protein